MRIISGKYKGRVIKMPKGIRPTQNKVRKAVFDILGDIEGLSFLELFSGSGAVGLEAISCGAGEVVFVERDSRCIETIEENLSVIRLSGYLVIRLDASKAIEHLAGQKRKFDIIFMDPPYYEGLTKKTLQILGACDILAPSGLIIVQHFKKDNLPETLGVLSLFRQSKYGDTVLSFYKKPCAK